MIKINKKMILFTIIKKLNKYCRILFVLSLLLISISCSTYSLPEPYIQDYDSDILCKGISDIIFYAKNDTIMQKYMLDNLLDSTGFTYKIDTLIQDGAYTGFFTTELVGLLAEKEKISKECAFNRLFHKNLQNEILRVSCRNNSMSFYKPQVEISFNYYPEYRLLVTLIRKITSIRKSKF